MLLPLLFFSSTPVIYSQLPAICLRSLVSPPPPPHTLLYFAISVPRPIRIPTSVKLIFIMKTDPSNRFILKGDGNAAKARYNMQADSYQESVWVDKWRDDIALFLIKQQWSIPSVGMVSHLIQSKSSSSLHSLHTLRHSKLP